MMKMFDIENRIKSCMAEAFNIEISLVNNSFNYNKNKPAEWTSMTHIALILSLEKEFDLKIPYSILPELITYNKIVEYICESKDQKTPKVRA